MLALFLVALSATAQDSISYRVDLSERDVQQVTIEARFRGVVGETLDFHLPVWRSGQYLIIDPVGTMSGIEVMNGDGSALPFVKPPNVYNGRTQRLMISLCATAFTLTVSAIAPVMRFRACIFESSCSVYLC